MIFLFMMIITNLNLMTCFFKELYDRPEPAKKNKKDVSRK